MKKHTHKRLSQWRSLLAILCFEGIVIMPVMGKDPVHVENVRFELSGDRVIIWYDLLADGENAKNDFQNYTGALAKGTARKASLSDDLEFKVTVILRTESDESFRYTPREVKGDVGIVHSLGRNKRIVWEFKKELPQGIDGSDFYFEIQTEVIPARSNLWLWIGGGAAVLGGGIAAYLILAGSKPEDSGGSFPRPPGRP